MTTYNSNSKLFSREATLLHTGESQTPELGKPRTSLAAYVLKGDLIFPALDSTLDYQRTPRSLEKSREVSGKRQLLTSASLVRIDIYYHNRLLELLQG